MAIDSAGNVAAEFAAERPERKQQWSSAVARIRDRARGIAGEAPVIGRRGVTSVEQQLPKIKALVADKVGPLARRTIEDDAAMATTFGMLYEFLPTTIRLMMQEETFVDFCLRNRRFLIDCLDREDQPVDAHGGAENALSRGDDASFEEFPQQA